MSYVTWNVKSLFKSVNSNLCSKFDVYKSLVSSHDFVGLTETHSTIERICMLPTPLPQSHLHYCAHRNADTSGVLHSVSKKFIQQCSPLGLSVWIAKGE